MKRNSKVRFRTNVVTPPIHTVVVAEGKENEASFDVPKPIGFHGTKLAFSLLGMLGKFQTLSAEVGDDGDPFRANMKLMEGLEEVCGNEKYWNELLPAVFGVSDDQEAIAHLQTYVVMETFTPFVEAAERIVSVAMGADEQEREEVEAALKKSGDGEEAVAVV